MSVFQFYVGEIGTAGGRIDGDPRGWERSSWSAAPASFWGSPVSVSYFASITIRSLFSLTRLSDFLLCRDDLIT